MPLDWPVHAPETADGTTARAVAALRQGRVAITSRAFCAAPVVL